MYSLSVTPSTCDGMGPWHASPWTPSVCYLLLCTRCWITCQLSLANITGCTFWAQFHTRHSVPTTQRGTEGGGTSIHAQATGLVSSSGGNPLPLCVTVGYMSVPAA